MSTDEMPLQFESVKFTGTSTVFGAFSATFDYKDKFQHLTVYDTNNDIIFETDDDSELTPHMLILSRVYEALNSYQAGHAATLLGCYLDTGDPFADIKK